jgi:V/A-type H+-transporting ATPase subunit D
LGDIKLTKNGLRTEQIRHKQLLKYLPTLQLKKAMLQHEVIHAKLDLLKYEKFYEDAKAEALKASSLLSKEVPIDFEQASKISAILKKQENIAGLEVPVLEGVIFEDYEYSLIETPVWVDSLIDKIKNLKTAKAKIEVAREKKELLEQELRQVSIRVNLFEKILIPRAERNMKKIKIFLGDQELASVSRSKVAKALKVNV